MTEHRTSTRRIFDDAGRAIDQSIRTSPIAATVSSIMTHTVYCVRPEVGAERLGELFLKFAVSGLPVVDDDGRPMGVVSKTDLLAYRHNRAPATATARELMMPIVFSVTRDTPIAKAAALMADEGIHRLPVVDGAGAVCGIVSTLDLVRWMATEAGYPVR